jgi:hypothetical protein
MSLNTKSIGFSIKRSMTLLILAVLFAGTLVSNGYSESEDLNQTLAKVKQLVEEKNFSAALEELSWARKEIEKMNSNQLSSYFPDQVDGFQGGKIEKNAAMGFSNIERSYTKANATINLSMTSGSLGGVAGGLGGLGALGQMAAMMGGNTPGQESLRIKGRTAMLEEGQGSPSLSLFLDSGPILKLEGSGSTSTKNLRDFASALPLDDLENYIKGTK